VTLVRNQVLLVLVVAGLAAVLFAGFVSHAPNRLLSGHPMSLWTSAPAAITAGIFGCLIGLGACAVAPPGVRGRIVAIVLGAGLILLALYGAGRSAASLIVPDLPAARTSLGPACWSLIAVGALVVVDALQRLRAGPLARVLVAAAVTAAIGGLLASGRLDALSILREYANERGAFTRELVRHVALVLAALAPALAIGAPLGVLIARRPRLGQGIYAGLNILQTIPSVALFGLLIAPLSAVAAAVPTLGAMGVQGIGFFPAMLALILYALLPIVRNTQAGIAAVDPAVIEAARGTGFTARQIFWRVEMPLALPIVLAGVRIVLVQTIGLAVVAALIGAGGLGTFVFQGLGQYATELVLLGAVPTIALALAADLVMRALIELAGRRRAR
jgi:osmoprotectant transport system permease protein